MHKNEFRAWNLQRWQVHVAAVLSHVMVAADRPRVREPLRRHHRPLLVEERTAAWQRSATTIWTSAGWRCQRVNLGLTSLWVFVVSTENRIPFSSWSLFGLLLFFFFFPRVCSAWISNHQTLQFSPLCLVLSGFSSSRVSLESKLCVCFQSFVFFFLPSASLSLSLAGCVCVCVCVCERTCAGFVFLLNISLMLLFIYLFLCLQRPLLGG